MQDQQDQIISDSVPLRPIVQHMQQSYLDYSVSVILGRALPDARDGFKPVQRRILYAMNDLKMTARNAYKKSARMVGETLGKYHPHGDSSVYEAACRLTRDYVMSAPLIDGQGNFGSIDADGAAAMRYTEMRMTALSGTFFEDLDPRIVPFAQNYDGSETEPKVLPVPFPQLLVNGTSGIAVGMASLIAPHNLRDVIAATRYLLNAPRDAQPQGATPAEGAADEAAESISEKDRKVIDLLRGPDFPTGGIVYELSGFAQAVVTGRGRVINRASWHEEDRSRNAQRIVIDALPYDTPKAALVESIATQVKEGRISGVTGIRDLSSKEGIRIEIDLAPEVSAETVFLNLCQKTDLEKSFNYNCVVVDQGRPVTLGLRELIERWIDFRRETVLNRLRLEHQTASERAHILDGLARALNDAQAAIDCIKQSSDSAQARASLMERFGVDAIQAQAILDLRLQRLARAEAQQTLDEHTKILARIETLNHLIATPQARDAIIDEELSSIDRDFGSERRTELRTDMGSVNQDDLIPRHDVVIAYTRRGYIKRIDAADLGRQNRATRGRRLMTAADDDAVQSVYHCSSHDTLAVFTETGRVHSIRAYEVPRSSPSGKDRHIRQVIDGLTGEISALLAIPQNAGDQWSVLTVSEQGTVKRSALHDYRNAGRAGGIIGLGLNEGDRLMQAFIARDNDHLVLVGQDGRAIRFNVAEIRVTGRSSIGVRGIRLTAGHTIAGAYVISSDGFGAASTTQVQEQVREQAREQGGTIQSEIAEPDGFDNGCDEDTTEEESFDTSGMDAGIFLLCIGENGIGKRTPLSAFGAQRRGGKGVYAFRVNQKTGRVVSAMGCRDDQDVILFASNGISNRIAVSSIRVTGRMASGVKLQDLDDGAVLRSAISVVGSGGKDSVDTNVDTAVEGGKSHDAAGGKE